MNGSGRLAAHALVDRGSGAGLRCFSERPGRRAPAGDLPRDARAALGLGRSEGRARRAAGEAAARAARERQRGTREAIAARIDHEMLRDHREVRSVRADGTVLRVRYIFCGRSFVTNDLQPLSEELRAAGFTRIECSTGYGERTTLDL